MFSTRDGLTQPLYSWRHQVSDAFYLQIYGFEKNVRTQSKGDTAAFKSCAPAPMAFNSCTAKPHRTKPDHGIFAARKAAAEHPPSFNASALNPAPRNLLFRSFMDGGEKHTWDVAINPSVLGEEAR